METKGSVGGRETDSPATDIRERVSILFQYSVPPLIRLRDRNWLEFLAVLDTTFSAEGNTAEHVEAARKFFTEIAERDGLKDRSGPLALLELEKRAKERSIPTGTSKILRDPLPALTAQRRPKCLGELPQVIFRSVWRQSLLF